jgi:predicted aspartyl protease
MRIRKVILIMTVAMLSVTLARGARIPGEIPFKLAQGFGIVVQGGIGPLTNLNFLVDTGAVPSVLNEKVASRIGVTGASGSLSVALLHKNIQAQYVTVDEVHFGSIRAVGLPMVVVDLARFERLLGTRIDAIIGLDALARQYFSIDYKRRRITPGSSGSTQHVVPVEILTLSGAPYWVLPINLGGHIFRVLLDTGANDLALFAGHTPKPDLDLPGAATTRPLRPLPLTMGDMPLKKQSTVVFDEPPGALQQIDGVLGPTALGITRIEFDWEHKCLRWDAE